MNRVLALLTILAAVCLQLGCAGFQSNNLDRVVVFSLDRANDVKPRIFFEIRLDSNISTESALIQENAQIGAFVRAVEASDCCFVTTDTQAATHRINITLEKYKSSAGLIPALFTRMSLYLIPSWSTTNFSIKVDVIDSQQQQHTYQLDDSWVIVSWLPMILVYPFYPVPEADEETLTNMNNHLLRQMQLDGII